MTFLGQTLTVAGKDLRVEVRGRYALAAVLPFTVTLLIAFGLSLGPGRTLLQQAAPGLLWLAVLFASILAFRQAYQAEGEAGAMEGLLLAPIDKGAVFPRVVLPLATPVRVAGVKAIEVAAAGRGGEAGAWLSLLVAVDLVYLGV